MSDHACALPSSGGLGQARQRLKIAAGGPIDKHNDKDGGNMNRITHHAARPIARALWTGIAPLSGARVSSFAV